MDEVILYNIAHLDDIIVKLGLSKMSKWLLQKLNKKLIKISKMVRKEINKDKNTEINKDKEIDSLLDDFESLTIRKKKRKL